MAFYTDILPGDSFAPNAILANDLRHLLNRTCDMQPLPIPGGRLQPVEVNVYNSSTVTLNEGETVNFVESGAIVDGIAPCKKLVSMGMQWGILKQPLTPNEIGSCVIYGPIKVKMSESAVYHENCFVMPDTANPDTYLYCGAGMQIVSASATEAIVLVNSYGYSTMDDDLTPFYITDEGTHLHVNRGFMTCNGIFRSVAAKNLSLPASGTKFVCVECYYRAASESFTYDITLEDEPDVNHRPIGVVYREPMYNEIRVINSGQFTVNFYFEH